MVNAMYSEVANHWAIGDSMDTCATETAWPMGYIQFVYATEQAAYQRAFNAPVTTDAWDVL